MGSGKANVAPQAPVYRDNPDRDDAASTSSAVLMDDIESSYPDEELPAYTDSVDEPQFQAGLPERARYRFVNYASPAIPFSKKDTFGQTTWTNYPEYSTRPEVLEDMIRTQAMFPPTYTLSIHGTHTEEVRKNGKSHSKNRVTDFWITIDITHLLTGNPGRIEEERIEILAPHERGYRGGIFPSKRPILSGLEEGDELGAWCEKFVSHKAQVKAFALKKKITGHDTKKLEQLIRSLVASTYYRGHLSVDFSMQNNEVVVFSPGKLNELRTIRWLRWFFYLTFLWLISWPVLFFMTKKYEVIKAVYPYSYDQGEGVPRKPAVMSEMEFYNRWESSLRRGILGRYEGCMDDEYRLATAEADARGVLPSRNAPFRLNGGNSYAEGAVRLLDAGLAYAADVRDSRGWGGDC